MTFGPVSLRQEKKREIRLPAGYPSGWWVPERSPAAMAVKGGPEMAAAEYHRAFLDKLVAAMDDLGREQARQSILSFLEPFNRETYFPEEADLETWARNLEGLLAFPLASPEDCGPASVEQAVRAVRAQQELSLSELLSAGAA